MDTITAIKNIAVEQVGGDADSVNLDAPVDQLGIDSLGFLEFLFELEDRLGISIPTDSVKDVKTLRDLSVVVDGLLATASQVPKG